MARKSRDIAKRVARETIAEIKSQVVSKVPKNLRENLI